MTTRTGCTQTLLSSDYIFFFHQRNRVFDFKKMYVTDRVSRSPSGIPIEGKSQTTSRGLRFTNVEQLEPSMATFEKFPAPLMLQLLCMDACAAQE